MPQFPLNVRIIAVGKIKGSHFAAASEDYLERVRHYLDIEIVEVRTTLGKGKPEPQALIDEGRELLRHVRAEAKLVALHSEGAQQTSAAFARALQSTLTGSLRKIDFVIGGAAGLSAEVLQRSHERFSLSTMTLPHELARVMLLEQLYRACTIMRGEKYHK
ncbi:23S rRNA (pseudouridine(1915)-N(3))-methyltransferase RlmH [candidate division KSB1 bacterium]|nr:23S rRNA (pseudouridine(1915)-N(3))-methyltransferase RlmH [candidate division KSB1 bacterium]